MIRRLLWRWGMALLLAAVLLLIPMAEGATTGRPEAIATPSTSIDEIDLAPFAPALPQDMYSKAHPAVSAQVELGRQLYYEKRLSKNQDLSCNSCHQLNRYGVDNQQFSSGHQGQLGGRNSPSVYNAAAHLAQFWDGRAADVEEQATGPILNSVEMAMPSEEQVIKVLNSMPEYVDAFKAAFPSQAQPVTLKNVGTAIGAFERGLVTPAPFDAYFAGDNTALTQQQKRGLKLFVDNGCVGCHAGTLVGGQAYQKAGLVNPWPNQADAGRYKLTGQEADRMQFKVPSLRNVAKTAPYFHDGSVKTLPEAVKAMANRQLGKDLSPAEVRDIVAFLGSLTGDLPRDYIQAPTLAMSTPDTPAADPS